MPKIRTKDIGHSPYREYTDLLAMRLKEPGEFGANDWLAMQKALQAALWDHATDVKPLPDDALPREMAVELAFALKEIAAGFETSLFMPVRSRGNPGRRPTETECIEAAVRYRRAVKAGLIEDPAPMKTIIAAYSAPGKVWGAAHRDTVRRWMKDRRFEHVKPDDVRAVEPQCMPGSATRRPHQSTSQVDRGSNEIFRPPLFAAIHDRGARTETPKQIGGFAPPSR